jgi:hypothetical protein
MGYSYGRNARGNWVLSCDGCGDLGGVRKRTCPHKVLGDSHRTMDGKRHALPYCPPPALCGACFRRHGGTARIHAQCADGAAQSQARYDETERQLDAGELLVTSASMVDGHPGMVRVMFAGRYHPGAGEARREAARVMPAELYDFHARPRLSDYDRKPAVIAA